MFTVRPYVATDAADWDALVARSRNGNLLHRRGYMDYHADRFVDASLMIMRGDAVVAAFPANRRESLVESHGGLSYAGLITSHALRTSGTLAVFDAIGEHYRRHGVARVLYKAVPHVYHAYPAEEDLFALHRQGARLHRRDLSSAISLRNVPQPARGRRTVANKAARAGIRIGPEEHLAGFHALLTHALRRHDAVPVHSLGELALLRDRFPGNIVLHGARNHEGLLAGVVIYDFGHAVHTQYMAVSDVGRRIDALSYLLNDLIGRVYAQRLSFTFGISTSREGALLNEGLVAQKEFFGARAVVHDFYEWTL